MGREISSIETFEIETLAARQNRHGHLADLSRREDELHMRRRLFQRLQERIEGRGRQHVDFVDDVDLVACGDGRITHPIEQIAHIGHTGPRGRIEFQHIGMPALHDSLAMLPRRIKLEARPLMIPAFIVESTGQKPGCRCLADPTHPRQHEGMGDTIQFKRIAQRPHHRFLANQVREETRTIFAGKHLIRRILLGGAHLILSEHGEGRVVALGFGRDIGFVSHA